MKRFTKKITVLMTIVIFFTGVFLGDFSLSIVNTFAASSVGVEYKTHVQTYGDLSWVSNGAVSGVTGQSKRLESLCVKLTNQSYSGSIEYRSQVEKYGWLSWVKNGTLSGTRGEGKRLEAVQIRLTGEMANKYDIYYRVHAQSFGWLGWAKNGASAGTEGLGYRLEAVQIKIVNKGSAAPGSTSNAFRHPQVKYRTHVQDVGWQGFVYGDNVSGTMGKSKRLEGIKIELVNPDYSGSITYRTHVEKKGWMQWVSNGALSGTTGEGKRLEAISIKLTGNIANYYDIYYRVHAQRFGWMGWAKNGTYAGTERYGYRLEAIQIKLVGKSGKAPGNVGNSYSIKPTTTAPPTTTPQPTTQPAPAPQPTQPAPQPTTPKPTTPTPQSTTYIVNINNGVFHKTNCPSAARMNESNKRYVNHTRAEMISLGYTPCGKCNP